MGLNLGLEFKIRSISICKYFKTHGYEKAFKARIYITSHTIERIRFYRQQ